MINTTVAPLVRHKQLSNTVVFGNAMVSVLLAGKETGGAFSVLEMLQCPGTEPPYHVHEREDETLYILEGEVSVMVDGTVRELSAGDCAFLPREVPHTFRVRSEKARAILMLTPAGFEQYFSEIGEPASSLEKPAAGQPRPDYFEVAGRAAGRLGVQLWPTQPEF